MKKTYRKSRQPDGQFALFQDDQLILTGTLDEISRSMTRQVTSTTNAIRQHGSEPELEMETIADEEGNITEQTITISWDEATKGELRCLELPLDSWKALEDLAESTGSLAKGGPYTGKPSWRTLIRRIANGGLKVIREEELSMTVRDTHSDS